MGVQDGESRAGIRGAPSSELFSLLPRAHHCSPLLEASPPPLFFSEVSELYFFLISLSYSLLSSRSFPEAVIPDSHEEPELREGRARFPELCSWLWFGESAGFRAPQLHPKHGAF